MQQQQQQALQMRGCGYIRVRAKYLRTGVSIKEIISRICFVRVCLLPTIRQYIFK